jgi:protein-S-isoprenylcysteine O-methyltransferase Ste14
MNAPASLIKPLALLCYLIALAGAGSFALFVPLLGAGLWPLGPVLAASSPWPVNLSWLLLFAVQHSVMARESFKRPWTRFVPPPLERSLYAALSGLLLLLLPFCWQAIPGAPLWDLPVGFVVLPLLAGVGLAAINARYDHAGLFGMRQAWLGDATASFSPVQGTGSPPETLIVGGPYRYVRHPLMACLLVFLWAQPKMTPTLLLLSAGLSAYVALGVVLEERDLLRRFGDEYAGYRRRVPALIPWRKPGP